MKKKTELEIKKEMEDFSRAVQTFREARRNAKSGADNMMDQTDSVDYQTGNTENVNEI